MKQPHAYICKYRIINFTLFKYTTWQSVAVYTGRWSSQPCPRSSLLSQKHHEAEKNFISTHLRGFGGVHPQVNRSFKQLVHNSHIDLAILSNNNGVA